MLKIHGKMILTNELTLIKNLNSDQSVPITSDS
jgi:hypothetical protein